jgi:PAS domain S-box-containing protein
LRAEIERRQRAEAALRTTEEEFQHLVADVQDYAIFLLDPQGHVISWNAGAERIKGYRAEEILASTSPASTLPRRPGKGRRRSN